MCVWGGGTGRACCRAVTLLIRNSGKTKRNSSRGEPHWRGDTINPSLPSIERLGMKWLGSDHYKIKHTFDLNADVYGIMLREREVGPDYSSHTEPRLKSKLHDVIKGTDRAALSIRVQLQNSIAKLGWAIVAAVFLHSGHFMACSHHFASGLRGRSHVCLLQKKTTDYFSL